jgi:queuine tRNA-ribosyltransferase
VFSVRTLSVSRARTGTLHLAHGDVRTPAFVPLATRGVVKTLEAQELAALGYELVLGNTFHLFLAPGPELVERLGGLHRFMRWERPIITDSGGFQVFSMGHGGVADEIKGRGRGGEGRKQESTGAILAIEEEGVRFRSYIDGGERFMGPETSMSVQAALGSDIALAFDECTPFHVTREYTARSTERTHRWLERCLRWHAEHGPDGQRVYGIVQGGVEHDLRLESAATVAASGCDGIAIGGSLGREKQQMYEVVAWTTAELERTVPERPRHLLGIGDIDDLIAGVELGIDTFDCALPTRLGRHGVALVPDPEARWRVDLVKSRWREAGEPILEHCPCPACARGYSRAYLHYLLRAGELTALRLVTLHNLGFIGRLMQDLRDAIDGGRLSEAAAALRAGAAPGSLQAGGTWGAHPIPGRLPDRDDQEDRNPLEGSHDR